MNNLTIDVQEEPRGVIVRLVGQGALDTVDQLQSSLKAVIDRQPAQVVVDMSQLTFAASLVMGTMVWLSGRVKQYGGAVKLAALQPNVLKAFETARMSWAIPIFETVESAWEA